MKREPLRPVQRLLSHSALPAVILGLFVFGLAYTARVSYGSSDPRFSLLVSQALLEHQTIKLDAYLQTADLLQKGAPILTINGHYYYFFPLGTSIFAVPFVWVANLIGKDMSVLENDLWTQNLVSAFMCAAIVLIIYHICRCYLNNRSSLVIATISVLGSSLISTLGTALWSLDFAAFFVSLALLLIARYESGRSNTHHPLLLGFCLFAAFFCRPTSAVFIALVLLYLLLKQRRSFLITAATAFFLLLMFQLGTWLEYEQTIFSYYYSPRRFQVHTNPVGGALYGHFFSPARGILVFSPFFVVVFAGAARFFRDLRRQPLFWLATSWFSLHVLTVSRSTRWWGGHSFGPRILTDAVPALVCLTVLVWRQANYPSDPRLKKAAATGYVLLGLVGVFINSYQGLYNVHTARWNGGLAPNIDRHPEYLFNWKYPQFLATHASLCQRNLEYILDAVEGEDLDLFVYSPGDEINYHSGHDEGIDLRDDKGNPLTDAASKMLQTTRDAMQAAWHHAVREGKLREIQRAFLPLVMKPLTQPNALFAGWSASETGYRWSECTSARIVFKLGSLDSAIARYRMEIRSGSLGEQNVTVLLNGTDIGRLSFPGSPARPSTRTLRFDGALLKPHGINQITFYLPDARQPDNGDARRLGLALRSLIITAEE
jgi:hypothetical protein